MPDISVSFAKVVATPTATAWSQAYNAGSLFLVVSLTTATDATDSLQNLGKKVLSNIEVEFFPLAEKTLHGIKQALSACCQDLENPVIFSLCVAYIKQDILYVFIAGNGNILLKRQTTTGVLLSNSGNLALPLAEHFKTIRAASGFLKPGDTILLETQQFTQSITPETLSTALECQLPNDIAETLSPHIHNKTEGGASALVLLFNGAEQMHQSPIPAEESDPEGHLSHTAPTTFSSTAEPPESEPQRATAESEPPGEDEEETLGTAVAKSQPFHTRSAWLQTLRARVTRLSPPNPRLLLLGLACILIGILLMSIFSTKTQQMNDQTKEIFTQIYPEAKKEYEEGEAIFSLNEELAQDSFQKARELLLTRNKELRKGSPEEQQVTELLQKLNARLGGREGQAASVQPATERDNLLLAVAAKQSSAKAFTQDKNTIYFVGDKAVSSTTSLTDTPSDIISNERTWENPVGIGTFLGNIYVLDHKTVTKFVPAGTGYNKTSYFANPPDLSTVTSLAVDGSVWLLFTDGTIQKYTRGTKEDFSVSSLPSPLTHPTQLVTNTETENLYLLDPQNSRIVVIAKNGTYKSQYANPNIKNAQYFDVAEGTKKLYFLANGKLFSLTL